MKEDVLVLPGMSARNVEQLKRAFNELDEDGDGKITVEELQKALTALNGGTVPPLSLVREMIAELDTDGNGTVDFEEFSTNQNSSLREELTTSDPTARLQATFAVFDRNGDGFISPRGPLTRPSSFLSSLPCPHSLLALSLVPLLLVPPYLVSHQNNRAV